MYNIKYSIINTIYIRYNIVSREKCFYENHKGGKIHL